MSSTNGVSGTRGETFSGQTPTAALAASGAPAGAPREQKEGSVHQAAPQTSNEQQSLAHQAVSTSSVPDGAHSGDAPASAPLAGGSEDLRSETPAEEALRSLACWLGAGGYNAPTVDAKVFEEKIRWGVENACKEAVRMVNRDAERYQWLRVRGAAFDGDPKRYLQQGLVYRIGNLDDAIDAARQVVPQSNERAECTEPSRISGGENAPGDGGSASHG